MIKKVAKLDFQTDSRTRGRFARMTVFINLDKPLVSQAMINGEVQRVEYEALPTICFSCGKYGHVKELCPSVVINLSLESEKKVEVENPGETGWLERC